MAGEGGTFPVLRFGRYNVRETVCGVSLIKGMYAVALLVGALQYSTSANGFDSRWDD